MFSNLKHVRLILLIYFVLSFNFSPIIAQNGEASFKKICLACHTIGKGKLIGPDLKDISQKRDAEWLVGFIKSSQDMIDSNDPAAVAIFEEYNKIPMPDANLTDAEIKQLIAYIDEQSKASVETDSDSTDVVDIVTGNIKVGRELFTGEKQLENGGAACISCHDVSDSEVYYGGKMSKDLTESYGVLKSAGINSVLSFLTFPAMENTYKEKNLTKAEISDLTAFLKHVNDNQAGSMNKSFDLMFFLYGFLFFMGLLFFLHTFWRNKKPDSVKEQIYNR